MSSLLDSNSTLSAFREQLNDSSCAMCPSNLIERVLQLVDPHTILLDVAQSITVVAVKARLKYRCLKELLDFRNELLCATLIQLAALVDSEQGCEVKPLLLDVGLEAFDLLQLQRGSRFYTQPSQVVLGGLRVQDPKYLVVYLPAGSLWSLN